MMISVAFSLVVLSVTAILTVHIVRAMWKCKVAVKQFDRTCIDTFSASKPGDGGGLELLKCEREIAPAVIVQEVRRLHQP